MNHMQSLKFTANARLKDIIGRGLIYNDNIAILELVKNSKDAGSPKVSIEFEKCDQCEGSTKLVISDIGHGMSLDDIKDKWLNIAYSEKRDVRLQGGGFFAGSKGIGRFSCDRLGNTLDLYTRTRGDGYIGLHIDWDDYEVNDLSTQIGDIDVQTRTMSTRKFEFETGKRDIPHGTVIVIRHLSAKWTKEKLLSLRKELERFSIDIDNQFEISLSHWKYSREDTVNQPIENKVFLDLDFRTTSVSATIGKDGKHIQIELRHDGDYIFKMQEKNPYSELRNVDAKIYFLNKTAKSFFKRRTGYRLEEYGSIHLLLNNFRISPYGSLGNDWLSLNTRESQSRILRTKDIVGFVKLTDKQGAFETVSSREGLVDNLAYRELTSQCGNTQEERENRQECGLIYKLIYKLEKFVIEGLDWDTLETHRCTDGASESNSNFDSLEKNNILLQSIAPVLRCKSPKKDIKNIIVNVDYITKIAKVISHDYKEELAELESKLSGLSYNEMRPTEKRDLSKLIDRMSEIVSVRDKTIASLQAKEADNKRKLNAEQKRRMFAETFYSKDNEKIAQINHQIGLLSLSSIEKLDWVGRKLREDFDSYTKSDLMELLEEVNFSFRKIYKVANLVLKANFDLTSDLVEDDLVQFIDEYIKNYTNIIDAYFLKVSMENRDNVSFPVCFRPTEVTILVDNLIMNSAKAKATHIEIKVSEKNGEIIIDFTDNGIGLSETFHSNDLFENGVTTTSGAGIGLHHVKQIVEEIGGTVSIRNGCVGAIVEVRFKK